MPPLDANRLRVLMDIADVSQADLAQRLGVSPAYVSQMLNGRRLLRSAPATRKRIANELRREIPCLRDWWIEQRQPEASSARPPATRRNVLPSPQPDRTKYDPHELVAYIVGTDDPKATLRSVARSLKVDASVLCRPLTANQADRYATLLGVNPNHVWVEWSLRSSPT